MTRVLVTGVNIGGHVAEILAGNGLPASACSVGHVKPTIVRRRPQLHGLVS